MYPIQENKRKRYRETKVWRRNLALDLQSCLLNHTTYGNNTRVRCKEITRLCKEMGDEIPEDVLIDDQTV